MYHSKWRLIGHRQMSVIAHYVEPIPRPSEFTHGHEVDCEVRDIQHVSQSHTLIVVDSVFRYPQYHPAFGGGRGRRAPHAHCHGSGRDKIH